MTGIVLGQAQSCIEVHRLLIGSCLRVAVMLARLVFGRHACPDASIGCTCITWLIHLLQTDMQLHAGVGELGEDIPWLRAWVCSMHNQTHSCSETAWRVLSVGLHAHVWLLLVVLHACLACKLSLTRHAFWIRLYVYVEFTACLASMFAAAGRCGPACRRH